jgi:uncharacterized OsmC-like protein
MGKNFTFQVNEKMAKALKETAKKEYCSIGAVIRKAVASHLREDGRNSERRRDQ